MPTCTDYRAVTDWRLAPLHPPKHFPIIAEVETQDPDDIIALLWLLSRYDLKLHAIILTPGAGDQYRLVRNLLDQMQLSCDPIIAFAKPPRPDYLLSKWHRETFGDFSNIPPTTVPLAAELYQELAEPVDNKYDPRFTIYTGGPPSPFDKIDNLIVAHWIAQGGFAGDEVVPEGQRLAKFRGRNTCPTWNFGGAPKTAERLLAAPRERIGRRLLVSKNVCHGVLAQDVAPHLRRPKSFMTCQQVAYDLFHRALTSLSPTKAVHDLLAVAALVDESVLTFAEVECYRERGAWGSHLATTPTRTWISTGCNVPKLIELLTLKP